MNGVVDADVVVAAGRSSAGEGDAQLRRRGEADRSAAARPEEHDRTAGLRGRDQRTGRRPARLDTSFPSAAKWRRLIFAPSSIPYLLRAADRI